VTINIVRPTDGWVLQQIAEAWQLPHSVCSVHPDYDADVNIWVNYAMFDTVGHMQKTNCDIGWFTHRERDNPLASLFDCVAMEMDHCIAMCNRTADQLPPDRTTVIRSAPSSLYPRRNIVLGIAGREYPRKRTHLVDAVKNIPGITGRHTMGKLNPTDLPQFYESVDYVLVLSSNEGGPMCVPEAMAMGKPVIAPDVGWCWDYPVVRYTDEADLLRVVRSLIPPTIEEESAQIMRVIDGLALC